jgi:hypothetical protein
VNKRANHGGNADPVIELKGKLSKITEKMRSKPFHRIGERLKLTTMNLKSYHRWDDYTKARNEMFAKTDVPWAPWHVTYSNDKKRARLNIIRHLLSSVKYKELVTEKVKLPKRKIGKDYMEQDCPFKLIPEEF